MAADCRQRREAGGPRIYPGGGSCDLYQEALAQAKRLDVILIPYELERGMQETRKIIEAIKPGQSVAVFIGPEGGFEKEEVEQALGCGARAVTLGRRILRTETAGLTALSVLMFHLET